MIDRLKKAFQEASDAIMEQAGSLGENAKERGYQLIEEWLSIFPRMQTYGLEMVNFSLTVALSPSLEVEMRGSHEDFSPEKIEQILKENKSSAAMISVFTTVKSTYTLYRSTGNPLTNPLIIRLKVKITPEIKVTIGQAWT
jgi:hypothetical protein